MSLVCDCSAEGEEECFANCPPEHRPPRCRCRAAITVIDLWPTYFDCGGCGVSVLKAEAWPFYEEFLPQDDANPGGFFMPACAGCSDRLRDHFGPARGGFRGV